MTNTTAPDAATTSAQLGTLEHLDPHSVELDANIRTLTNLTPRFIESIKDEGVLQPVTAIRRADGTIAIRDGQRRTLAARQAQRATIPVYITTEDDTNDETAREFGRVGHQFTTNEERERLTGKERVDAMTYLLDLKVTPTKIARKLHVDPADVAAARVVAKASSPAATNAYDSGALTLEQAAVLAEFDDDDEMSQDLLDAAAVGNFDHEAEIARQRRRTHARRREASTEYAAKGHLVLLDRPFWYDDNAPVEFRRLVTALGKPAVPGDVNDPALLAVFLQESEHTIDIDTDEPVDPDSVDWDTANEDNLEPAEGLRHASTVETRSVWTPEWFCVDPAQAGLRVAGFRGAKDAEDPDAASAARRRVLALNKLGLAAETVRRKWVREELLARKTPPAEAAGFVAVSLAGDVFLLTQNKARSTTVELLGAAADRLTDDIDAATPGRAQVLTLALVLGAYEARTAKDAWRRGHTTKGVDRYLHFLRDLGYRLSDVERVAAGDLRAEDIDTD